jgi:hypothetical protein
METETGELTYYRTAERPALQFWLEDEAGALIDFTTGYSFVFKLGYEGAAAVFTKASGITGAAGSGTELAGIPNVTIAFTPDELVLPAATYRWQLRASAPGSLDRVYQGLLRLLDVIT